MTGRYEAYLGTVPTLLLDGKAVMQAMEDTPEAWDMVVDIARTLGRAHVAAAQADQEALTTPDGTLGHTATSEKAATGTSHAAERLAVLRLVAAAGLRGTIAGVVADQLGASRNQIGARLLELRNAGYVEYVEGPGGRRVERSTDTVKSSYVQVATPAGRAAAAADDLPSSRRGRARASR